MFKTIAAKFPGTCKRCGRGFEAGAKIRYGGRGRTYHLKAECPAGADGAPAVTDGKTRAAGQYDETDDLMRAYEDRCAAAVGMDSWARHYDSLNGAPEGDWDR